MRPNSSTDTLYLLDIIREDAQIAQQYLLLSPTRPWVSTSTRSSKLKILLKEKETSGALPVLVHSEVSFLELYYGSNSTISTHPSIEVIDEITSLGKAKTEEYTLIQSMISDPTPDQMLENIVSYEARYRTQKSWKGSQKRRWRRAWWRFTDMMSKFTIY